MKEKDSQWNDQDRLQDLFASEGALTTSYDSAVKGSVTPMLHDELLSLLAESHQIRLEVTKELSKRGWYQPAEASPQEIQQVKRQYAERHPLSFSS